MGDKAREELKKAEKALADAEKALADAEAKVSDAQLKLDTAESNLSYFVDTVWAAYQWLLSEKNDGNYDNSSYVDPLPAKHYGPPIPGKQNTVTTTGIMAAPIDDP